jgi:hypothetical protein
LCERVAALEAMLDCFESVALCRGRVEIVAKQRVGHPDRRFVTYFDGAAGGVAPTLEAAFRDLPRVAPSLLEGRDP